MDGTTKETKKKRRYRPAKVRPAAGAIVNAAEEVRVPVYEPVVRMIVTAVVALIGPDTAGPSIVNALVAARRNRMLDVTVPVPCKVRRDRPSADCVMIPAIDCAAATFTVMA